MHPKATPTAACVNCGAEELRFLHHVRHRGIFRRLCTSCVLRLHPQSFCPTCFQVHPPPPAPQDGAFLTCTKCYSSSHTRCVSSSSYVCSLCTHPPGTPLFRLKSAKEANLGGNFRVIDTDGARKLLAAAKIAKHSINTATICAWEEAEKRAREAGYARKRAKEALEYLAYVAGKTRKKKHESARPQVNVKSDAGSVVSRGDHSVIRGGDGLSREVVNVAADRDNNNNIIHYDEMNGDGNGEVVDVDIDDGVLANDAAPNVDQRVNDSMISEMVTSVDEVRDARDNSDDGGGEAKESVVLERDVVVRSS